MEKIRNERAPRLVTSGSKQLEVGLVLLDLHHKLVDVDKLPPVRVVPVGGVRHDLVEPVVVLHELRQGLLQDVRPVLEVREGAEDLPVDRV